MTWGEFVSCEVSWGEKCYTREKRTVGDVNVDEVLIEYVFSW